MPGHARRHYAVSCAKMAKRIDMPFELWTRVGTRKHVLGIGCTLAQPGEYHWTVHVRQRWSLFVKLL